jgi:hypothetical protein
LTPNPLLYAWDSSSISSCYVCSPKEEKKLATSTVDIYVPNKRRGI